MEYSSGLKSDINLGGSETVLLKEETGADIEYGINWSEEELVALTMEFFVAISWDCWKTKWWSEVVKGGMGESDNRAKGVTGDWLCSWGLSMEISMGIWSWALTMASFGDREDLVEKLKNVIGFRVRSRIGLGSWNWFHHSCLSLKINYGIVYCFGERWREIKKKK